MLLLTFLHLGHSKSLCNGSQRSWRLFTGIRAVKIVLNIYQCTSCPVLYLKQQFPLREQPNQKATLL